MDKMTIFDLSLEKYKTVVLTVNFWVFIIFLVAIYLLIKLMKFITDEAITSSIDIEEVELGIGNNKVKLKYNRKEKEIAYKLWVELNTRKIGLEYEEDYDVISEVYDSWYKAFDITRQLIKDIPVTHINETSELIRVTTKVLNRGLRPHLTRWQAKFRRWYKIAIENLDNKSLSPQEIQKKFPEYDDLIADLKITNKRLIKYKELVERIAFDK